MKSKIQLFNGDCLEEMKKIKDKSIDLILTDPPYGVDFKNNFYNDKKEHVNTQSVEWLKECERVLKDNSHIYLFVGTKNLTDWLLNISKTNLKLNNILTCKKLCSGNANSKNNFYHRYEPVLYLSKGKAKNFNKYDFIEKPDSYFQDKRTKYRDEKFSYQYPNLIDNCFTEIKPNKYNKKIHPNQKNVKLLEFFIGISSQEKETVLDFTMGSGSTGVACKNLNRNFIGIELDEEYFKIAKQRIENV